MFFSFKSLNKRSQFYMKISIPHSYFNDIDLNEIELDFVFQYGGEEYMCNKLIACSICKKIQIKKLGNILLNSFTIPKIDGIDGDFSIFIDLFRNIPLHVSEDNMIFVYYISSYLQIDIILESINKDIHNYMDCEFALNYVQRFYDFGADISVFIDILCDHLPNILDERFMQLNPVIIDSIFRLYGELPKNDIIKSTILKYKGRLLSYLNHVFLEDDEIIKLVETQECNLNYLRDQINYLVCKKEFLPKQNNKRFLFDGTNPLEGIINYIYQKTKGNPAIKGEIGIESSRPVSSPYKVENILENLANSSSFKTKSGEPFWFIIDFKNPFVIIDGYTISTFPKENGSIGPYTWTLSGSCDSQNWCVIDERINFDFEKIEDKTKTMTFTLPKKNNIYQYIKFEQTELNKSGTLMAIINFELFGVLCQNEINKQENQ